MAFHSNLNNNVTGGIYSGHLMISDVNGYESDDEASSASIESKSVENINLQSNEHINENSQFQQIHTPNINDSRLSQIPLSFLSNAGDIMTSSTGDSIKYPPIKPVYYNEYNSQSLIYTSPKENYPNIELSKQKRLEDMTAFDNSLSRLFQCLTEKPMSPRWNWFRGLKLHLKDKLRLNNILWRAWHMQFIYRIKPSVCQFEVTEDEKIPQIIVLEGTYWKRRLDSVIAEYRKWRISMKDCLRYHHGITPKKCNFKLEYKLPNILKTCHTLKDLGEIITKFNDVSSRRSSKDGLIPETFLLSSYNSSAGASISTSHVHHTKLSSAALTNTSSADDLFELMEVVVSNNQFNKNFAGSFEEFCLFPEYLNDVALVNEFENIEDLLHPNSHGVTEIVANDINAIFNMNDHKQPEISDDTNKVFMTNYQTKLLVHDTNFPLKHNESLLGSATPMVPTHSGCPPEKRESERKKYVPTHTYKHDTLLLSRTLNQPQLNRLRGPDTRCMQSLEPLEELVRSTKRSYYHLLQNASLPEETVNQDVVVQTNSIAGNDKNQLSKHKTLNSVASMDMIIDSNNLEKVLPPNEALILCTSENISKHLNKKAAIAVNSSIPLTMQYSTPYLLAPFVSTLAHNSIVSKMMPCTFIPSLITTAKTSSTPLVFSTIASSNICLNKTLEANHESSLTRNNVEMQKSFLGGNNETTPLLNASITSSNNNITVVRPYYRKIAPAGPYPNHSAMVTANLSTPNSTLLTLTLNNNQTSRQSLSSHSISTAQNSLECAPLFMTYDERKRYTHITSEHKRRCYIKQGFDDILSVLPQTIAQPSISGVWNNLNLPSSAFLPNARPVPPTKLSKAAILNRACEHIKQMREEIAKSTQNVIKLRTHMNTLKQDIGMCQRSLNTMDGERNNLLHVVPQNLPNHFIINSNIFNDHNHLQSLAEERIKERLEQACTQRFETYLRNQCDTHWKYKIFCIIVKPLFASYNANVIIGQSLDSLCQSIMNWVNSFFTLAFLRPIVSNGLVGISSRTCILSDPQQFANYMKTTSDYDILVPPTTKWPVT